MAFDDGQIGPLLGLDLGPAVRRLLGDLGRVPGAEANVAREGHFADAPGAMPDDVEPLLLCHLARLNKSILYLDLGPGRESLDLLVAPMRLPIAAMNLAALALGREVDGLLSATGIRPLHIKGPLQQADLLGSPALKPVSDVDLLVAAQDRTRAAAVLMAAGFEPQDPRLASWWSLFLGERHFRKGPGSVVDLHHRLDQPGLPRVRDLPALFEDAREQPWGGTAFLVPSRLDQALIASIGIAKAVVASEPCGSHLVDARVAIDRLDEEDRRRLRRRADRLGLGGVLTLAARAVDAAFGRAVRGSDRRQDDAALLPQVKDDELRVMLIAPWMLSRLRRRSILWALSGGSLPLFLGEMGRMLLSDGYRHALGALPWPAGRGVERLAPLRPGVGG